MLDTGELFGGGGHCTPVSMSSESVLGFLREDVVDIHFPQQFCSPWSGLVDCTVRSWKIYGRTLPPPPPLAFVVFSVSCNGFSLPEALRKLTCLYPVPPYC